MNINIIKNDHDAYYRKTFRRWRTDKEKAGKDIVGEEYEAKRKQFWQRFGFTTHREKIGSYNPDIVIRNSTGKIVAIEEDKGHYVDSCFLDRFIMNAARVFNTYIDNNADEKDVPYFVLSCMTKYNNYDKKYKLNRSMFSREIQSLMDKRIVYLPYCEHDRVKAKEYFKSNNSCFTLSDELLEKQIKFAKTL